MGQTKRVATGARFRWLTGWVVMAYALAAVGVACCVLAAVILLQGGGVGWAIIWLTFGACLFLIRRLWLRLARLRVMLYRGRTIKVERLVK